jgi:hypothetical protein
LTVQFYAHPDSKGQPLDAKLLQILDRHGGTFVEAGANAGLSLSNTAMRKQHFGWSGLLVEPSPEAFQRCVANRTSPAYNCALVAFTFPGGQVAGDFADGSPMASVGGTRAERR